MASVTPFRNTWQAVVDAWRVVTIVASAAAFAGFCRYVAAVVRVLPRHQGSMRAMLGVGLLCFAVSATFTELGRLGHPLTWRLPFNFTGAVCAAAGVVVFLRHGVE